MKAASLAGELRMQRWMAGLRQSMVERDKSRLRRLQYQ
jgi:hypothetical protein